MKLLKIKSIMVYSLLFILLSLPSVYPYPNPQIDEDTPSPPVILDEEEYTEYEYGPLVEEELKDIHKKLFESKEILQQPPGRPESTSSNKPNLSILEERIREDPDFNFEPVGVEISVVVSHSPEPDPEQDQELNLDQDPGVERILELLNLDPTETSVSLATKTDSDPTLEPVENLGLILNWWQILLILIASLLLTSLCCYFSGCCFLVADCCSDPFWGCCPCCKGCARLLKPPSRGPIEKEKRKKDQSSYSLNENHTAPRSSLDRAAVHSVVPRLERGSQRSIGSTAGRKTNDTDGTLLITNGTDGGVDSSANQETRTSRTSRASRASSESIRNISTSVYTTEDTPQPGQGLSGVRNYRRMSRTSTQESTRGLGRTHSFQESTKGLDLLEELNGRANSRKSSRTEGQQSDRRGHSRKPSYSGEPANNWVYEDSSGYFSWLTKLGKKRHYTVSTPPKKQNSRQNNIYRQSRYHHIAESRNSAVIPVKLTKRSSTASNYNIRPTRVRSRSYGSESSEEDSPILESKSERHLASRLSTNLADLERSNQARNRSGTESGVERYTLQFPDENCTLQYIQKSLLGSKETTL